MKLPKLETPQYGIQFREAADKFRLIDDANYYSILIPYKDGKGYIEEFKKSRQPEWRLLRKLQRYTINIYEREFINLRDRGSIEELIPGIFALNNTLEYSATTGLLLDETVFSPSFGT